MYVCIYIYIYISVYTYTHAPEVLPKRGQKDPRSATPPPADAWTITSVYIYIHRERDR